MFFIAIRLPRRDKITARNDSNFFRLPEKSFLIISHTDIENTEILKFSRRHGDFKCSHRYGEYKDFNCLI
ncbi:MAG: hypothetical protein J6W29_05680 [Neisseriaceae bacterium]|nr:hypothetical protein [Neisseriaceae bacterium]